MKNTAKLATLFLAFACLASCDKTLVKQDTDPINNQEPTASGGQLVRVITEYTAGGHNVCDISTSVKWAN